VLVSRLLGDIAGGEPIEGKSGDLGEIVFDFNAMGIRPRGETFALRVDGDSMIGAGINDGDVVIIEKRPHRSGHIVAALVDGRVTLKRYIEEDTRQLLRAENAHYRDIILGESSRVQGVAIAVIHELPT
jgi:SOS-response transcriptional repressor LexA